MARFALRHWTGIIIVVVVAWWAVFYLPATPSYFVYQLKRAIDARDGAAAAAFVDFPSVIKKAGYEMVENKAGNDNLISQMVSKGAVDILSKPMAALVQAWTEQQVNNGSKDVQMPGWAVLAALVTIQRSGDSARTEFKDAKGRAWDIRMARGPDRRWRVVEVRNLQPLLAKLNNEAAP